MSITVSVVIPAYNAGEYLGRALDSVLAQTRPAEEIIVVDDGSTDNTADVAQGYGDKVRFIRQENTGASVARNTGIEAATSEWIAFLDADDEWLPQKLKLQTEHLRRNPELVWTTGNFIRCYCDTNRRENDLKGERLEKAKAILGEKEYFKTYFQAYQAYAKGCTDTVLVKRDALFAAGLFAPGQLRINDYDMWLRVAYSKSPLGCIIEPLAVAHRDVPNSIVKRYRDPEIISAFIERHLELARNKGAFDEFKPCAARMLGWWIHVFLTEKRGRVVRDILRRFGPLYSPYYKTTTFIKSWFPGLGLWHDQCKKGMRKRRGNMRSAG
ncbi:MAG: glycosyltransferase family 2 protein [Planctomycetes bacterium]|nr:glycosyltransferase family 2 protein [Planctomycetota bacterium]